MAEVMAALPGKLEQIQRSARERYQALAWPQKTDEEWRRTDPAWLSQVHPEAQAQTPGISVSCQTPPSEQIHAGLILTDLSAALKQFPELVEEYLFQSGVPEGLPKFAALHEAMANQGLFCYVPDGLRVDGALTTRIELTPGAELAFPHVLLVVGEGAELTFIDHRQTSELGLGEHLSNEMVEIILKPGAVLRYIRVQRWGASVKEIFMQRALVARDAQLTSVTVGFGGSLTKANVETVLQGPGARSELLGVFFSTGKQHFDFHTLQDHQAPHTFSDLLYKSALKDQSRAVYTGLIRMGKAAQKSDAYQANRNLLLDQGAKADSIPMLEIEANDVKCTHGVAVGPVDWEALYYLMSRGLPEAEAQKLIVEGFFEQVLQKIPSEELRQELMSQIEQRLTT